MKSRKNLLLSAIRLLTLYLNINTNMRIMNVVKNAGQIKLQSVEIKLYFLKRIFYSTLTLRIDVLFSPNLCFTFRTFFSKYFSYYKRIFMKTVPLKAISENESSRQPFLTFYK